MKQEKNMGKIRQIKNEIRACNATLDEAETRLRNTVEELSAPQTFSTEAKVLLSVLALATGFFFGYRGKLSGFRKVLTKAIKIAKSSGDFYLLIDLLRMASAKIAHSPDKKIEKIYPPF